ncbi:hypothetical protein T439DRAFT_354778 [Meredithblackwellia eburnea MCA 4105]
MTPGIAVEKQLPEIPVQVHQSIVTGGEKFLSSTLRAIKELNDSTMERLARIEDRLVWLREALATQDARASQAQEIQAKGEEDRLQLEQIRVALEGAQENPHPVAVSTSDVYPTILEAPDNIAASLRDDELVDASVDDHLEEFEIINKEYASGDQDLIIVPNTSTVPEMCHVMWLSRESAIQRLGDDWDSESEDEGDDFDYSDMPPLMDPEDL